MIGSTPLFTEEVKNDLLFLPFKETYGAAHPHFAYGTYGVNALVRDDEIDYALDGTAGASWTIFKSAMEIDLLPDSEALTFKLDLGAIDYPEAWAPDTAGTTPYTQLPAPTVASGKSYEIGPGKDFEHISDFPWENLKAGDTVYIYWREEPYREKIGIFAEGTDGAPITIHGVPGPKGQLPVIDGDNAVTRVAPGFKLNGPAGRTLIRLGEPNRPAGHIILENLEVTNAHRDKSYVSNPDANTKKNYDKNANGIWIDNGHHITIRNNLIHNNGNGVFISSWNGIGYYDGYFDPWDDSSVKDIGKLFESYHDYVSDSVLVQGNTFRDNGVVNSIFEHHAYSAGLNTIYEYNRFEPLLNEDLPYTMKGNTVVHAKTPGYGLKDRGAGTVIRYNYI